MPHRTTLFSLLFTISCGKKDDSGEPPDSVVPCASSFSLTLSDGETLSFDECRLQGAEAQFAVAPDAIIPQLHRLSFIFRTSEDVNNDCWVLWELDGICTERDTHSFGTQGSTLSWNTFDCDIPSEVRGVHEAISGGSVFLERTVAPEAGLNEGDPMAVTVQATLNGTSSSGQSVDGTVDIAESLPLITIPYAGCEGANGDSDGDGSDGEAFGGPDCDDENPQIGPHAEEVCDGIDNNCDGQIDEGKILTFYTDADEDGYGDSDLPIEACEQPEGTSTNSGDCDDNAPSINPGEEEVCDGEDNDCDETVDEGSDEVVIYVDADGDGYGVDPAIDVSCPDDIPEGYSDKTGDCDDEDETIYEDCP